LQDRGIVDRMIIKTLKDISKIPRHARKVRITTSLTTNFAETLVRQCPNLAYVVLTQWAKSKTNKQNIHFLYSKGIDVIYDSAGRGRPVTFSREDLSKMIAMRKEGMPHAQIARKVGLSVTEVSRALRGKLKFQRWTEDYDIKGQDKVVWMIVRDANPDAKNLADNHYSRKSPGAKFFCGPGEKLVLMTPDKKALFVWRKNKYRQDGQNGVECALFRNEGAGLSSALIKEALKIAKEKWADERFFTYVKPTAIKSDNPGFCFKRAGWKEVGINKRGNLVILEAPK